jgi:thiol-disulfide isomerase/thioredoxin
MSLLSMVIFRAQHAAARTRFWSRTATVMLLTPLLYATPLSAAPPLSEAAPDFTLRALSGENRRLSEHFGEVVLLNFWASWSGPSRQELPVLDELYSKYRRAGLVLLGVNLDDDPERATEMVDTLNVSFPVLLDTRKDVARDYHISAMPLTVLIDRVGVVRFVSASYKPGDEERYAQELRKLLNE